MQIYLQKTSYSVSENLHISKIFTTFASEMKIKIKAKKKQERTRRVPILDHAYYK